jgi:hypothetical protein
MPAWSAHAVSPVTNGQRDALIATAFGTPFRLVAARSRPVMGPEEADASS